jgi:hypothetical protein
MSGRLTNAWRKRIVSSVVGSILKDSQDRVFVEVNKELAALMDEVYRDCDLDSMAAFKKYLSFSRAISLDGSLTRNLRPLWRPVRECTSFWLDSFKANREYPVLIGRYGLDFPRSFFPRVRKVLCKLSEYLNDVNNVYSTASAAVSSVTTVKALVGLYPEFREFVEMPNGAVREVSPQKVADLFKRRG